MNRACFYRHGKVQKELGKMLKFKELKKRSVSEKNSRVSDRLSKRKNEIVAISWDNRKIAKPRIMIVCGKLS